jgi:hypothetical protein
LLTVPPRAPLVVPGRPAEAAALGYLHPIATKVVDRAGVGVLERWIAGLGDPYMP